MNLSHTRLGTALIAVLVASAAAHAQESIDQQNDPTTSASFSCGSPPILNASIQQSFVPSQDSLSAVELRLRAGSAFPDAGLTTTMRIRAGSPTGTVLAESSADVAGPLAHLDQVVVRFGFDGIALTPGETYVIEWDTPNSTSLTWMGATGDPYAAGTAYTCAATVWPGGETDFNFTTYYTVADAPSKPASPCAAIESLSDFVSKAVDGHAARRLDKRLAVACRFVKKGNPHVARVNLEIFRHKVAILVCLGAIDASAGEQMRDAAEQIIADLGESTRHRKSCRDSRRRHRR